MAKTSVHDGKVAKKLVRRQDAYEKSLKNYNNPRAIRRPGSQNRKKRV